MVKADGDLVWYQPWLMVKYTKVKWMQLKNFPADAAQADFSRMFESLKGQGRWRTGPLAGAHEDTLLHRPVERP